MIGDLYTNEEADLTVRYIDGENYVIIPVHPDSFFRAFGIYLDGEGFHVPVDFDIHESENLKSAIINDHSNFNSSGT